MIAAPFWRVLGIAPTADERVIRGAYAAKLKQTNPEDDPEGFKAVRAAYDAALRYARWNVRVIAYEKARRDEQPETEVEDELYEGDEFAFPDTTPPRPDGGHPSRDVGRPPRADAEDARWLDPSVVARDSHNADFSEPPLDDAARVRLEGRRAVEEHAAACNRLVGDLAAGAPAERLSASLETILQSEAMAQLDVYARTQTWLVHVLHNARPQSDVLIDRTIEFFKWRPGRERINEWDGPQAVLALRARIAHERERDAFLERVADRRHEFHPAWREMRPETGRRNGLAQLLSLRWIMHAERFLAFVDAKMPSALEKLDGVKVAWWRRHVFHIGPWFFAARALILFVVCSVALSFVRLPPPERSDFQELRAAAYALGHDRAAARRLCKLAAQRTPSLAAQRAAGNTPKRLALNAAREDCRQAAELVPESLLLRQYSGILELKSENAGAAVEHFDAILAASPLDAAALYGKGLARLALAKTPPEEKPADRFLLRRALRLDPAVRSYFNSFGVETREDLTGAAALRPRLRARPAPHVDTPPAPLGPPANVTLEESRTIEAYKRLGAPPFVEGRVELECLVTTFGDLIECLIVEEAPANHGLAELALVISRSVFYTPARLAEEPVNGFPVRVPITFEATDSHERSMRPAPPSKGVPAQTSRHDGDLPLEPATPACDSTPC